MYAIKAKLPEDKAWWFIAPQGRETRLRIHASMFDRLRADLYAIWLRENNPHLIFKVVPLFKAGAR